MPQLDLIWRAHPVLCIALTRGIAALRASRDNKRNPDRSEGNSEKKPINFISDDELQNYNGADVPTLKWVHGSAFACSIILPLAAKLASNAGVNIFGKAADTILPIMGRVPTISAINAASTLVYCLYSTWQLRSLGFVKTQKAVIGGFASVTALGLAGPGAAIAGMSYWRESVISDLGKLYS